ncbi:DNA polymerase I [Oscillospiraceae bacterium MB08-C2-2]|nr:DNA polymerase I [Oscillospiraceae bacterium MB08-C2-2]
MKLLAIDGNSIINRAFYGVRPLTTKDGLHTNAIYGFLSILQKMLSETKPDGVAVAFDLKAPTFRHKKYEGYKAQRKGMPEELAQQLPLLKELLPYLGYTTVELSGYEADDLLGTLSKSCCQGGNSCVIATGDRDSFQLIGDCVTVRLASTKGGQPQSQFCDEAYIRETYGVEPLQLIDVKALMGDTSDNVPGVAGVGEKTALKLIQEHGTLDAIYEKLEDLDIRPALREKLRNGKDMAYLSRELVTIDRDSPIDTSLASYAVRPADMANAYSLLARLEIFSLMDKLGVYPVEGAVSQPVETKIQCTNREELGAADAAELISRAKALDALFFFEGEEPGGIFVSVQGEGCIERLCFDHELEETAKILLESALPKRVNHIKNLYRYCLRKNISPQNLVFDLEIAAYILNPTATDYSIQRLAGEYQLPYEPDSEKQEELAHHLAQLAVYPALADKLYQTMDENDQLHLFTDIELPLAKVLAHMEHAGVAVDAAGLTEYGQRLDVEIAKYQAEIYSMAGEEFNINSPKQMGVILFEKLGLPAKKKTKTGYSTNADVLEGLMDKHPIIPAILEYRKVAKLKSTYVDGLLKVIEPDGRIHTVFQQTLTRTGRISSTEPNMQNIPIRTELGSELRRFFHAEAGNVLVDADYSQIELRVLTHIAEDENMIAAFKNGEDIHTITASQVFDLPPLFVTPVMRSRAKAVNFGIVYGIGAFSLAQDIGVSVAEADSYIKGYLRTYSGVKQYMEDTIAYATDHGYVKTMLGRRRYLPELSSSNRITREFGKRVAMNTPIQGTAADIIKIAMVRVFDRLQAEGLRSRLILQVHDELIIESPQDEEQQARRVIQEEMEHAISLTVPLDADVGTGQNWLDAK